MMFKDQEIHCSDCGTRFGFTAEEQAFYADKGLAHPPRRCKPCRLARKQQRQGRREDRPLVRNHRTRRPGPPDPAGPFVRRSRRNSHGQSDSLPWQRGGKERRPGGRWSPRHGKGGWSPQGWQAPGSGGGAGGGSGDGGQGAGQGGGAPLFKADFGPLPGQDGPGRRGASDSGRRQAGTRQEMPGNRRRQGGARQAPRAGSGPPTLHDAVCSECSAPTQVPFKPNNVAPVYCRACLPVHRPRKSPPRGPAAGEA